MKKFQFSKLILGATNLSRLSEEEKQSKLQRIGHFHEEKRIF